MEYKCSVCSEAFKDLKQFWLHKKAHSITPQSVYKSDDKSVEIVDNPLTCNVCYRTFKSEVGLGCDGVTCRNCKQAGNACELDQHEAKVLSADDQVEHLSAQIFSSIDSIKLPARTFNFEVKTNEENSQPLKIEDFLEAPSEMTITENSYVNIDNQAPTNFVCDTCGKDFRQEHLLRHHMRTHSGNKCSQCGQVFQRKVSLEVHINLQHKYMCEPCEVAFKTKKDLEKHVELCPKANDMYVCEVCGKTLRRKSIFSHRMTHKNGKDFACEECGQRFVFERQLRNHFRVHPDVKPYKCSDCNESFKLSTHLKSHAMWHMWEKSHYVNFKDTSVKKEKLDFFDA